MATPRTAKTALFRMIQHSPLPIYAVSSEMKILFCNEALCQLTGLDHDFLTEMTCVYQSASDQPPSRQIAAGLCPPPDSFQGTPMDGWISIPGKSPSGKRRMIEFRQARFLPTHPDESGSQADSGVLVFVHGAACTTPSAELKPDESPDARQLHAAICRMQYESVNTSRMDRLVGISAVSRRIRKQVELASQSDANVLIIGPRGSNRRNIAPLVHYANGPEMVGPLVPVHCPVSDVETIQETIKQLYRDQKDYPDEPLGRILLLDIDQLSEAGQIELTGFLKLPDFRLPLLSTATPGCGDKINQELWPFLTTMVIELPKLSSRREDIPYLVQAVVEQFNDSHHAQLAGFDDKTMALMVRYSWPGELDELIAAVDFACQASTSPTIVTNDLPEHLRIAMRVDSQMSTPEKTTIDLDQFLAEIEEELIRRAVHHSGGNKSEAARLLGISRARLLRRLNVESDTMDRRETSGEESDPA